MPSWGEFGLLCAYLAIGALVLSFCIAIVGLGVSAFYSSILQAKRAHLWALDRPVQTVNAQNVVEERPVKVQKGLSA
jgi:hypothetical protein